MTKINCEICVTFDARVNVVDSNIDIIFGKADQGKEQVCRINVTPVQARAIIDSTNAPEQFICSGKVQSYFKIGNEFDELIIQVTENSMSKVYTTDTGIVYQLKDALAQVDAINTLLGQ